MDYHKEFERLVEIISNENASDLHLAEGRNPIIRVGSFLAPLLKWPALTRENMEGYMGVLLSKKNEARFLETREVDFSFGLRDVMRFRGNGYMQRGLLSFALRVIPREIRTLAELGLPPILETFAGRRQGFFLVVGPVGQGKSTTLASMVEIINRTRAEHIITIEDPIEYIYEPKKAIIDQREVRIDTGDFKTALQSTFRQDVNVILVGEMRDPETMATAVTAAETGHLVFSTLHTNNASQTVDRIIDSFPATQQEQIRTQLAGSLLGIFSQRLLPRIAGGLSPAYELLVNTPATANLIREGRTHELPSALETGSEHGMVALNRSLAELVGAGEISVEDAYTHSYNPQALEKML
ncbi:MAG: PilT/PilU family type 4a pilus ATPase [bacterium]|nr:PilT/PilU family type 4a pilus ATPase [bacterium]MDZ4284262.1 PilT/PilU family type 4a pilus ATPase [Patescibacteria group bacterium]